MGLGREVSASSRRGLPCPALGGSPLTSGLVISGLARLARASAPSLRGVGADVEIVWRHCVTLGAELQCMNPGVVIRGQRLQVLRAPAALVPALMVKLSPFGNRAHQRQPSGLVNGKHPVADTNAGVSLPVTDIAGQRAAGDPAPILHFAPEPQSVNQRGAYQPLLGHKLSRPLHAGVVHPAVPLPGMRSIAMVHAAGFGHDGSVALWA
jgi:hypothetical protein